MVSVTLQNSTAYGNEYEITGYHIARYEIQDYALGAGYYIDGWGFEPRYSTEGNTIGYLYVPYLAYGPRYNSRRSSLQLGKTAAATAALNMPQGYIPGRAVWDKLTPAEKEFVIRKTDVAIAFNNEKNNAVFETERRFPATDLEQKDDGNYANAYLHALWSTYMAWAQGAALAEEFGNAHEAYTATGREALFRDMDLHNNAVGRQIAVDNPGAGREQLTNLVTQALNEGRLRIICPPTCRE